MRVQLPSFKAMDTIDSIFLLQICRGTNAGDIYIAPPQSMVIISLNAALECFVGHVHGLLM